MAEIECPMTIIALRFPTGRFHATPWGRHVNEGAPEWPPSPWRLLRALIAVWKIRSNEVSEASVQPLFQALSAPPKFVLPEASLGHTRHYMPMGYSKGIEKTTKVFDAFVSMDRKTDLLAVWPTVSLDSAQRELLSLLLGRLSYFGRAESWCDARLLPADSSPGTPNCRPLAADASPRDGEELVRVLCPDPDTAFSDEHVRVKKGRPVYEPAWNIAIETGQLHKEKWSDPPGARWVTYVREADSLQGSSRRPAPARERPLLHVARYSLDSNVLPLVTATLPLAERVRCALMSRMPGKAPSQIFSGKDANSSPRQGHQHAYYLPTDEDGDGRLDHITVYTREGFGSAELRAIDALRALTPRGDEPEIRLLLLGIAAAGQLEARPLACSTEWISATPYISTRHPKRGADRREFLEANLRDELARFAERNQAPATATIAPLTDEAGVFRLPSQAGAGLRPLQFKRFRSGKPSDDGGRRLSGYFRLRFPAPVPGPISLGHSAHFGMGLFLQPERLD